jgi:hypothetical protein
MNDIGQHHTCVAIPETDGPNMEEQMGLYDEVDINNTYDVPNVPESHTSKSNYSRAFNLFLSRIIGGYLGKVGGTDHTRSDKIADRKATETR